MARFLLIPHAPTTGLAHLGACLSVARELRERGHEPIFAYGGSRPELIEGEGFEWRPVPEVPAEREWQPDAWFETGEELSAAVAGHLAVIEELEPVAAVSSSGLAGRLACKLAGVPLLHLMHYVAKTPFGRRAMVWADRRHDLRHPRRAWRIGRTHARSLARRRRSKPISDAVAAVCAERGLPAPGDAMTTGWTDTITGLTTTPALDPARGLPESWRYIGPVLWSWPGEGVPLDGDGPLVYVTQGSTGDSEHLRSAVRELAALPVRLVVATGGLCEPEELEAMGDSVLARDLLPNRECLEAADAAVIHGGHLTYCEAVRAGTPVLILPRRRDQIGRVNRAERLGTGFGLHPVPLRHGAVRRGVARLLRDHRYRDRCAELGAELRERWDGARNAADVAEGLAAGSPLPDAVPVPR